VCGRAGLQNAKEGAYFGLLRGLTQRLVFANGLDLGLARTPYDAVRQAGISAVRVGTQELLVDEDVENRVAGVVIDAAETMQLPRRESKARHFQEFGAETFDDRFHDDLAFRSKRTEGLQCTLAIRTAQDGKSTSIFAGGCGISVTLRTSPRCWTV
jgi:hypothetical protein